jgi:hypothetical protein
MRPNEPQYHGDHLLLSHFLEFLRIDQTCTEEMKTRWFVALWGLTCSVQHPVYMRNNVLPVLANVHDNNALLHRMISTFQVRPAYAEDINVTMNCEPAMLVDDNAFRSLPPRHQALESWPDYRRDEYHVLEIKFRQSNPAHATFSAYTTTWRGIFAPGCVNITSTAKISCIMSPGGHTPEAESAYFTNTILPSLHSSLVSKTGQITFKLGCALRWVSDQADRDLLFDMQSVMCPAFWGMAPQGITFFAMCVDPVHENQNDDAEIIGWSHVSLSICCLSDSNTNTDYTLFREYRIQCSMRRHQIPAENHVACINHEGTTNGPSLTGAYSFDAGLPFESPPVFERGMYKVDLGEGNTGFFSTDLLQFGNFMS